MAVALADPLNVALAPLLGAVKVTETPVNGFEEESVTCACRAAVNAAPVLAVCGVPAMAEIVCGAPRVVEVLTI